MKRNDTSRLAHPAVSSFVNILGGPFAGLGRALLYVSLAVLCAAWSAPTLRAQTNFGSVNVCPSGATTPAPCNKTLAVSFTVPASGALGTPKVFTQGAPNLDFTLASGNTCIGTVTEGATCTVKVTFAPTAPGQRKGGVQLVDGSGNFLANAYIYGIGVGPAIAFSPSPLTILVSGFDGASDVTVDESGNVFVTDYRSRLLQEILAVNGSIPANFTITTLVSNFMITPFGTLLAPYGVAVDGSGNVFVTGTDFEVYEILAVNGSVPANPTINALASGGGSPAVDGSGNVFVQGSHNDVQEILAVNGSIPVNPTINTVVSDLVNLAGFAVDAGGNVFVAEDADEDQGSVVQEILAVNGSIPANPTIKTLGSGFDLPDAVAVDGSGNVFVADYGTGKVYEILAVNGSIPANPTINALSSSLQDPPGALSVDGRGGLFVGGHFHSSVSEIQRSQPSSLRFAPTPVGTTSSDSPQSVQIQNIGNATLTGSGVLSDTTDFTVVPGSGAPPDCNLATFSLAPGVECNLSLDFRPRSLGPLNATLTLSDNALNGNPGTQTIPLAGGVLPQAQVSPLAMQFGAIFFGIDIVEQPLTITNIGLGTLTVSASIGGPSYTLSGSTCTGGVTAGNSCTLPVTFSPITVGSHVDILTLQTNGAPNPTVTLHGIAKGVGTKMEGPLQFGTIAFGTTKVLPLTITNTGWPGTITVGTKIGGPSYKVLTNAQNTCLVGITAGHSCTLPIEFDPVSVGMHDDILTLTPSGGAVPSTAHLDGFAN